MLNLISKIALNLFLFAAPFLFVGFGKETLKIVFRFFRSIIHAGSPLFAAQLFFLPCLFVAKRLFCSAWCWLETFEHEITHLLIGLLFLKIPVGFRVSAHAGGEVRQIGRGTTGQIWVTLAPYFFPDRFAFRSNRRVFSKIGHFDSARHFRLDDDFSSRQQLGRDELSPTGFAESRNHKDDFNFCP